MATVSAREPLLARHLLLADETTHPHAGHPFLAALVRRHPPGLDGAHVVPSRRSSPTVPTAR
ncbi:hypothetical protein NKH77_12305 [Streptomyces sp. M19]